MNNKFFARIFFITTIILAPFLQAQHLTGAEISYKYVSGNAFELTLVVYKDCAAPNEIDNFQTINYISSICGLNGVVSMNLFSTDIIKTCSRGLSKCEGGTVNAYQKKIFKGNVDLPIKCPDYKFQWRAEARTAELTTLQTVSGLFVEATLNSSVAPTNSSPFFQQDPFIFAFENSPKRYFQVCSDTIDFDDTQSSIILPRESNATTLNYNSGFSITNPVSMSAPITIDPVTSEVVFTPTVANQVTAIALKNTEFRGGVEIGSVMRDFQFKIEPNAPQPSLSGINGGGRNAKEISVCVGSQISFSIVGNSPTGNYLSMTVTPDTTIGNYSFVSIPEIGTVSGVFSFNPTGAGIYRLNFSLSDGNCPLEGSDNIQIRVVVNPKPIITGLNTSYSIPNCSSPINIEANPVISNGKSPFTYTWRKNSTDNVSNASSYVFTSTGFYEFLVKDANGCLSSATTNVNARLRANFKAVFDTQCETDSTAFENRTPSPSPAVVTNYEWNFGDGSPIVSRSPSLTTNIKHKYASNGKYNVILTAYSSDGCTSVKADTVKIYSVPNVMITFDGENFKCRGPGYLKPGVRVTNLLPSADASDIYTIWKIYDSPSGLYTPYINKPVIHITQSTSLGISYVISFGGCSVKDSVNINTNPSPVFTNVTPTFAPVCTIPGFPVFELQALASVSGAAQASSGQTIYYWDTTLVRPARIEELKIITTTSANLSIQLKNQERQYIINVKDALGCTNTTTIGILDSLKPEFKFKQYYCNSSSTIVIEDASTFRGSNLANYQWDLGNGSTIPGVNSPIQSPLTLTGHPLNATSFIKLSVEDIYGCKDSYSLPLMKYDPTNTFDVSDLEPCFNETISFTGISSYASSLLGNNVNYWTWDYGNGQKDSLVNHRTYQVNNKLSKNQVVTVIGGNTFLYADRNLSQTLAFTVPGVYTIRHRVGYNDAGFLTKPNTLTTVGVAHGCKLEFSRVITVSSNIAYKINPILNNYCVGSPTTITSSRMVASVTSPIQTFDWDIRRAITRSPITDAYTPLEDGSKVGITFTNNGTTVVGNAYKAYLTVTDTRGCTGIDSSIIENALIKNATITGLTTDCQNKIIPFNYSVENNTSKSNFSNSIWYVEGTDSVYYVNGGLSPSFLFLSSNNNTHNYTVSFTGASPFNKCISTFSGIYTSIKSPLGAFTIPGSWCNSDELAINPSFQSFTSTPSTGLESQWFTESNTTSPFRQNDQNPFSYKFSSAGSKKLILITRDPNTNCTHTATGVSNISNKPVADFTFKSSDATDDPYVYATSDIKFDDKSIVDASSVSVTKTWLMGNGVEFTSNQSEPYNIVYKYDESKIFFASLIVNNSGSCKDTLTKKIDLTSFLRMPNAFNPNDDKEMNRTFGPYLNGVKELKVFKIFNRWGQIVFESIDPKAAWNGKVNNTGSEAPTGVYLYHIEANTGKNSDDLKEYKGQVTLIR